jgi:hypothetical protein
LDIAPDCVVDGNNILLHDVLSSAELWQARGHFRTALP